MSAIAAQTMGLSRFADLSASPDECLLSREFLIVFEVLFRASKSALGVGPKAPTSVPVNQLRRAGVHGWLQVAATGTAVSETDIFASSICLATATSSLWST